MSKERVIRLRVDNKFVGVDEFLSTALTLDDLYLQEYRTRYVKSEYPR